MQLKFRFLTLLLILTISIPEANSATPPKPGAKCAKLGSTKIYETNQFTCTKSGKKLIWKLGASVNKTNDFKESGTTVDSENCKLQDARIRKLQPNNVGFPLQEDIIPVKGEINVIVIPVDFSDSPAGNLPTGYLIEQTKNMNEWYKHFSAGQVSLSFQIGNKWIRAPEPDSKYVVPKSIANSPGVAGEIQYKLAQDIVTASGDTFDFKKSNAIFFYMPTIKSVDHDMGGRGITLNTPNGNKSFFFWGGGAYHFDNRNLKANVKKEKMWAFWIHEMLHSQGLALHSPANGSSTGLHTDQYGASLAIDSWELFRLGWVREPNIACLDLNNEINNRLILKPVELGSKLAKFAIVKLNSYEALIIESRRPIGYSKEWKSDQKGILVYRIDVRNDNDRSGESTGDTGNSAAFPKWGYLLNPDDKDLRNLSHYEIERYILRKNQTASYLNIRIKLIDSVEDEDLIEITKL
jgi:hypothetical protein